VLGGGSKVLALPRPRHDGRWVGGRYSRRQGSPTAAGSKPMTAKMAAITLRLVVPCRGRGVVCLAGVEDGRGPLLGFAPPIRGFAPLAPGPLPSSTPAKQTTPCGVCEAERSSRGVVGGGSSRRCSLCSPATASSLDLQQMTPTDARDRFQSQARNQKGGPRGVDSLPGRLRRAVNRQAPVLRFASAFQVTARRPPGGPLLPSVRHARSFRCR